MARRKANLAEVIQTDVVGTMPLKTLAKVLASKGRRGDTILAHITPKEAKKLKKAGGAGTLNPETGLPEFYEEGIPTFGYEFTPDVSPPQQGPTYSDLGITGGGQEYGPTYADLGITAGGQDYGPDISYAQPVISVNQKSLQQAVEPYRFYRADSVAGIPNFGYDTGSQQFTALTPPAAPGLSPIETQVAALGGGRGVAGVEQTVADAGKQADITTPKEQPKTPAEQKSFTDKLLASLSDPKNLLGLGIAGGGGLLAYASQQRAAAQAKQAADQIKAAYAQAAQQQKELAQPLIGPGYTQLSQALQGAMSPATLQAYQAAQARAAQASARSGGVGAVQTALQEEALRQQLLANQQAQALSLIAPGNTLIQSAIQNQINATTQSLQTGINIQQAANQSANQMYAALGGALAGGMLKG